MKRLASLLAVVVVVITALYLVQYVYPPSVVEIAPQHPAAQTTGVVKSLVSKFPPWGSSAQRAAVTLRDGSEVEATVVPGCTVRAGDAVRLHVLLSADLSQRAYLIVGPD